MIGDPLIEMTVSLLEALPAWGRAHHERIEILQSYRRKVRQPLEAEIADLKQTLEASARVLTEAVRELKAERDTWLRLCGEAEKEAEGLGYELTNARADRDAWERKYAECRRELATMKGERVDGQ